MNDIILQLVHRAMPVFSAYRDANLILLDRCHKTQPQLGPLAYLLAKHVADRQQAATSMVQEGRLWDAEILLRSAAEAALKLLFICLAQDQERMERVREYLEALPAVADLRQSERARVKLSVLAQNARERPIFEALVLSDDQEREIRAKWPRKARQMLNAKWSFSEMVEWVDAELGLRGYPDVMRTLLHNYGISSHLIHADERGLTLVQERHERTPEVQWKMENAHAARLMTDMLSYSAMVGRAVGEVVKNHQPSTLDEAYRLFRDYLALVQPIFDTFYESQESLYRNLGFLDD